MSRRFSHSIITVLGGLLLSGSVLASANLRWLSDSPARYFTDKDWELAQAAANNALENAKDGDTVEWQNDDSGARGNMTPLSTAERDGRTCRELKIRSFAKKLEGGGTFEFCKQEDGRWTFAQGANQ